MQIKIPLNYLSSLNRHLPVNFAIQLAATLSMLRVFSFNSRVMRVDIEFGFTPLFKKEG
jgi:hypothetical protein